MTFKDQLINYARIGVLVGVSAVFLFPYLTLVMGSSKAKTAATPTPTISSNALWVPPTDSRPANADVYTSWDQKPVTYTAGTMGMNLPWLEKAGGKELVNWLGDKYDAALIERDLADIQAMGVTKIRTFCQLESIYSYQNQKFVLNEQYAAHLDDYLSRAKRHGLSVICVMGDGNYSLPNRNFDGSLRWELLRTPAGLAAYKEAYISYLQRFKHHDNILMWDMINEPYGSLVWSAAAKELKITRDEVHRFLVQQYQAIKPLAGAVPVGFSDLEELQQPQFQLYSSDAMRKSWVDDCTDIYAMHIYRASPDQVADFRGLTGKPKWVLELGAYNYNDPAAIEHQIPAANELYDPKENYIATRAITNKLLNSGFELVMPWGFSSNRGMVVHNDDGSNTLGGFAAYLKAQLRKQ